MTTHALNLRADRAMGLSFARSIMPPTRRSLLAMDGYFVWDGSLIRDDAGRYQLYASRWPAPYGFRGWLTDSRVIRAEADSLDGPFVFREQLDVLNAQPWSRDMAHNARVYRIGDRYCMYYIGTRWDDADPALARSIRNDEEFAHWTAIRFRQRIGLATAPTAAGPWSPCPTNPIFAPRADAWDRGMVTNPAVFTFPGGRVGMIYKSTAGPRQPLMLGAAVADAPEGPFERIGPSPLIDADIEDPCVWGVEGDYMMLVKDMTGKVCGLRNGGVLYRSEDALNWRLASDAPAYDLTLPWHDGPTEQATFVERPYVYIEDQQPAALVNATLVEPGPSAVLVRPLDSHAATKALQ